MTTTYIQIQNIGNLEVKEDIILPLNFRINEVQDIAKSKGGYSKTIVCVGSANNNNIFSHLFNVNLSNSSFDFNKKQRCQIIQNGLEVFSGFLQLKNIIKISPSSPNEDEFIEYEVEVQEDSGNFFSSMQEKMLEDLSNFDQYTHLYTIDSITATSAHTYVDAYTYFLPWKGTDIYQITDFTPAIYAKAYWDRIFLDAGYTYVWEDLEALGFDKLIVPYNGDTAKSTLIDKFRAGFTTGSIISNTVTSIAGVQSNEVQMIFNNEITPPNFDDNNQYAANTGVFTSNFAGNAEFQTRYILRLTLVVPVDARFAQNTPNGGVTFDLKQNTKKNTENNFTFLASETYYQDGVDLSAGTYVLISERTVQANTVLELNIGDTVSTRNNLTVFTKGVWEDPNTGVPLTGSDIPFFLLSWKIQPTDYNNNYFLVEPSGNINEGQFVELRNFIPKKVKQRDFIAGIVKLFRLYIYPEKYNPTNLIIKTRDDYYDDGIEVDWSDKLNQNSPINLVNTPDLQDKRLILSYKQDNDGWNEFYRLGTNETYGQVQYEFESEFVQSTNLIETIFSPTPIVNNTNGLIVPGIVSKAPKNNIRILYHSGWVDGEWEYSNLPVPLPSSITSFQKYPRALHLDDPILPSLDYNFAQPDSYMYGGPFINTYNNLYNKYWSRTINQIATGQLLTGYFYLTEKDIQQLDLSSKIWCMNKYWTINSIIDYSATVQKLTKVELLSIDDSTRLNVQPIVQEVTTSGIDGVNAVNNNVSIATAPQNNVFGTGVVNTPVFGSDNIIQGRTKSSLIMGDGNKVNSSDSIVVGQNNDVQGNNLYVFGNDVTVATDNQAVFNVPIAATSISATTIFLDGSTTPIEAPVWVAGSAGNFSIKADNDTTTDATGNYAVAEGSDTLASGPNSHAEGIDTIASGAACHAEGNNSRALGTTCHAEGVDTIASGTGTHTEGIDTQAGGQATHAQGSGSVALGLATHAGGVKSTSRFDGEITSNGSDIGNAGITQFGIVNTRETTNNATPTLVDFTSLGVNQGGFSPPLAILGANDIAMSFTYQIVCFRASSGTARIITGEGLIKWISGTPTLVFASTPSVNGDIALLGVTATPVADTFGLKFQVTGLAAATLTWAIRMDYNY
jgi:hypothetical protein